MTRRLFVSVLLAGLVGCVPPPGAKPVASPKATTKPRGGTGPLASPATGAVDASLAGLEGLEKRVIAQAETLIGRTRLVGATELTGKAKLLSDYGGGLVSNNSGNLVSDAGGGIVSNNAGGLVSNNSGNLIGRTRYALAQAPAEAGLVEARIEVLDARGRLLVDEKNQPLGAITDGQGGFKFAAALPDEALVLRIRLFPARGGGGELRALVPYVPGAKAREVVLDTASSLGASYVLERFVKGQQAVLDKLGAADAEALRRDAEAARGGLPGVPSYQPGELTAAVERLRPQAPALDSTLKRIEAILLAGQAAFGEGLPATAIALGQPSALALDGEGRLLVGEHPLGRVRAIPLGDPAAPTRIVAGLAATEGSGDGGPARDARFGTLDAIVRLADGTLWVGDAALAQVRAIAPDGTISTLPMAGPALPLVRPKAIALLPDGALLIGEGPFSRDDPGRLLRRAPDGQVTVETLPGVAGNVGFLALAVGPDGTAWGLDRTGGRLLERAPGGTWRQVVADLRLSVLAGLAPAPQGGVYVSESGANRVLHVAPGGAVTPIAGDGASGTSPDGTPAARARLSLPAGLAVAADGTLYVADNGNNLVRAIAPTGDRPITTIAGTLAAQQVGGAVGLPINGPGGLALDPQGRVVVTESLSHVVKRLENGALAVVAGSQRGDAGDGGPALSAQFAAPSGIAYWGDKLVVSDTSNLRIRQVDAAGTVTTIAKQGARPEAGRTRYPALAMPLEAVTNVVAGPDGALWWADHILHQVWRLDASGEAELVAGSPTAERGDGGDGGPSAEARLDTPWGLAFTPDGKGLYVADLANMRVRKIDLSTPTRTITTVIGKPLGETLPLMGEAGFAAPTRAQDAALALPAGLAVDGEGNLFIAEFGTNRLDALGADLGAAVNLFPRVAARVRKLAPDGTVTVVAGPGGQVLTDPGAANALLAPGVLMIDADGRLVIADIGANRLMLVPRDAF